MLRQRALRLALIGAGLALCGSAQAQADFPFYRDGLLHGWQNWSWSSALDFNNANPVRSGVRSLKVTYNSAWAGLYLSRPPRNSMVGYQSVSFWIHGGVVANRTIHLKPVLNYEVQEGVHINPYIDGGQVRANEWRKVVVPLSALNISNPHYVTGFVLQEGSGGAQPTFYLDDIQLDAAPAPAAANLTVSLSPTVRVADGRVFGLNAAIWDSAFDTPANVTLLQEMGNRVLRFPGGSLSNLYHWRTNTTADNTWQWATSFDKFANVATQTKAQVFISVNYGTGTPQEAADWVRYANVTKGYRVKYWEIGNENYGSWEADDNDRPHDPYTYAVRSADYIAQMKAVDPTIKVGVVVVTGEDSYANYSDRSATNPRTNQTHRGWTPVLLDTLRQRNVTPDFAIYHRYEQGPGGEYDPFLLQSAATWQDDASSLRQMLTDYLGANGSKVELVCTELNSVYTNPGKQTTSLVNALFMADSVGQVLQTEFNTLLWWDLRNSQETQNNNEAGLYGWRLYGDYGMMSGNNDLYPTYYAGKIVSRFARHGDRVLSANSDYGLLSIYATHRSDRSLRLLIINKGGVAAVTANLNVGTYLPATTGTFMTYGIPQDEAARTGGSGQDVATGSFSVAGSRFTRTFPPYSITLLTLYPGKTRQPR